MKRPDPIAMSWTTFICVYLVPPLALFALMLLPEIAAAAEGNNPFISENSKVNKENLGEAGKYYWGLIQETGVWIALGAGAILYMLGLTQYLRWAVGVFAILAFGELFVEGLRNVGARLL